MPGGMWEFVHMLGLLLSLVLAKSLPDACETRPRTVFVWFGMENTFCVLRTHSGSMGSLAVADGMMLLSSTGGSYTDLAHAPGP